MSTLASDYWKWAALSVSASHKERVLAEKLANIYLRSLDVVETNEESAADLILDLLRVPRNLDEWHVRQIVHGLLDEAIRLYGLEFIQTIAARAASDLQDRVRLLQYYWRERA